MKLKLWAILSATTLALTACGGGGDSDDSSVKVNQSINPNEQPFKMKEQVMLWQMNKNGMLVINDSPATPIGQDSNNNTALTQIKIDGKTIPLMKGTTDTLSNGTKWNSDIDNNTDYMSVTGADTAYARYGLIALYDNNKKVAKLGLFYQGNPTSLDDMKKLDNQTADITYKGQAYILKQGNYDLNQSNTSNPLGIGITQLTANFKNKTLKGTISQWSSEYASTLKPVSIDAKIQANTFSGTANKTGTVEGKFYGANAKELAGAFNDKSQKLRGVFSGVKQ